MYWWMIQQDLYIYLNKLLSVEQVHAFFCWYTISKQHLFTTSCVYFQNTRLAFKVPFCVFPPCSQDPGKNQRSVIHVKFVDMTSNTHFEFLHGARGITVLFKNPVLACPDPGFEHLFSLNHSYSRKRVWRASNPYPPEWKSWTLS